MTPAKPIIVSAEVVAERTGIEWYIQPRSAQSDHPLSGVAARCVVNDKELKAKVDRLYFSGRLADTDGVQWYIQPTTHRNHADVSSSPTTALSPSTARTCAVSSHTSAT